MSSYWLVLAACGGVLQLALIFLMTRGGYRRYPWVFVYLLILFLTGVADISGATDPEFWERTYPNIFFLNDIARYLSGYIAVISLYFIATADHKRRSAMRIRVLAAALAAILISLLVTSEPGSGDYPMQYFQVVSRNLGFITALMIAALWVALAKSHTANFVLLLVSAGMGINMAGSAIAHSLYDALPQSTAGWIIPNVIGIGSHFLCLGIWIWAFRYEIRAAGSANGGMSQRVGVTTSESEAGALPSTDRKR